MFRIKQSRAVALTVVAVLLLGMVAGGLGSIGIASAQEATNSTSSAGSQEAASSTPSESVIEFAQRLTNASSKEKAQKIFSNHPKLAEKLAKAMEKSGIHNAMSLLKSGPKYAAKFYLPVGDTPLNNPSSDQNESSDVPEVGFPKDPVPGDGPIIPTVEEIVKQAITTITNIITSGVATLVNFLNWVLLTLPAPGQALNPLSWFPGFVSPMSDAPGSSSTGAGGGVSATLNGTAGNATAGIPTSPPKSLHLNKWWTGVWVMYAGLTGLVALPLFISWIYKWSRRAQTPRERTRRLLEIGKPLGLIILGPVILPLGLHLASMTAIGIVPSGQEFLTSGSVEKLGIGVVFGSIILAIDSIIILVGVAVTFVQWVLPFFLVAAWPLAGLCLGSENKHLEPYGYSIIFGFISLLLLKIIQALWLRFLFKLPVDFSVGGLLAVVTIAVGVLLGFVYLPYYVVKSILPNVVSTMGSRASDVERDDIPTRSDIPSRSDLPSREDIPSREDLPGRENIPFYGSGSDDGGDSGTGSTRTIGEVRERTRDRPQSNRDDVATDGGVLAQSDTGRQSRRQQQVEKARHEASDGADHPDQTTLDNHTGSREESVELGEANVRQSGRLSETTQVRTRTHGPSGERTNTVSGNSSVGNTRPDVGPTDMGDDASSESGSGSGGVAAKAGAAVAVANEGRQRASQRWNGVRRRWQKTKQRFPDGLRARQRPNEGGQSDSEDEGNSENSRPQYRVQFTPGTQDQNGSESSTETTTDDESGNESSGQNKSQRRQFLRRHSSDNSRATGRGHESGSSSENGSSGESSRRQALRERYGSDETNSSDDSGAESANGESNS